MFGLGLLEIVVLLLVGVLLIKPEDLPRLQKTLRDMIDSFRGDEDEKP